MSQESAPVSVVIPCFRCGGTARRAIASVAAQTLRPLEVLVVDDGSDDDTATVLDAIASEYGTQWLHVVRLGVNRGAAAARNAGWSAARGRYVAFLDADDAWHPRKLELQWGFVDAHPEVAVCGHGHRHVKSLDQLPDPGEHVVARTITFDQLLLSNRFVTPSALVRRDIPLRFREARRHMEDHLLWLECAATGLRIVTIDAPLAAIFKREFGEGGLSAQVVRMTAADIGNYWLLFRLNLLALPRAALFSVWAVLKSVRRFAILLLRNIEQRNRTVGTDTTSENPRT